MSAEVWAVVRQDWVRLQGKADAVVNVAQGVYW